MIRKSAFFLDETEQMIIPLQVPSHPTPFFLRYRVSYFYISPNRVFEHPTAKAVGFFARIFANTDAKKMQPGDPAGFPGCTSFLSVVPCLYAIGCQTGDVCAPLLSHHPV